MAKAIATTVRIIPHIPTASGRRKGWIKLLSCIDRIREGGYALQGDFLLEREIDVEPGTVLVRCTPQGSVKHSYNEYDWGRVQPDGTIAWDGESYTGKTWLSFLDALEQEAGVGVYEANESDSPEGSKPVVNENVIAAVQSAIDRLNTPGIDAAIFNSVKSLMISGGADNETISRTAEGIWPRYDCEENLINSPVIRIVETKSSYRAIPVNGWSLAKIGKKTSLELMSQEHYDYYLMTHEEGSNLFLKVEYFENEVDLIFIPAKRVPEYMLASLAQG